MDASALFCPSIYNGISEMVFWTESERFEQYIFRETHLNW